ncbi:MAG: helix-turn-helix domain-containing protein [Melioribacteraceae bacterium]|nr:helix-turn-helix domain-containing protein [Melioribacteraceae bacterium]
MKKSLQNDEIIKKAIGERIKEFAKSKYGFSKKLAEELGMTQQTLQQYLVGKSYPGGQILKKLSELGADVEYILTGNNKKQRIVDEVYDEIEKTRSGYEFPLVHYLSAGSMIEFFSDNVVERVTFNYRKKDGCMALMVKGDSMHPTIEDGDIVLVDSDKSLYKGCIVATRLKTGEQLIKRYRVLPDDYIQLDSDNFLYEPITIKKEDIEIIMPVVRIQRNVYKNDLSGKKE